MGLDWTNASQIATSVAAVGGLLFGLWRYVGVPVYNVFARVRESSAAISENLPSLLRLAEHYPSTIDDPCPLKTEIAKLSHDIEFLNWYRGILSKELLGGFPSICFFECDASGRIVFISKSWQLLTGMDCLDSLGWGWTNAIHPSEREKFLEGWEKNIAFQENFQLDFRIIGADKQPSKVRCKVFVLKRKQGELSVIGSIEENG